MLRLHLKFTKFCLPLNSQFSWLRPFIRQKDLISKVINVSMQKIKIELDIFFVNHRQNLVLTVGSGIALKFSIYPSHM